MDPEERNILAPMSDDTPPPRPDPADDIRLGDVVRLRKPHPCGADSWRVVRIGAEIGLRCTGCDRKVLLLRRIYRQRFRSRLSRSDETTE